MNQATGGTPYRVPPEPRRWSAMVLAVAVHALLVAFLVVGIHWQNNKPAAVEAEVWDMKVQSAAPPPPPPPPQETEPQPEPEPAPVPKVVEPPAPPAPVPDIRLEKEKKRKEELKQKQAAEQKAREEQQARELQDKKEAAKKAKEDAARKEAEQKAKELAEKKEKAKAEKAEKAKAAAAAAAKEKVRQQELQRMMAQAGSGTSGSAAKSTAPRTDAGYDAALRAKIKSNTTFLGSTDVAGNPKASFQVEQLPTGDIISVRMIKSSGVPAFDRAVENGIHKSSPLPKKKDGTVERTLVVDFSMKDLD
jgi:colicin import membrane protein